MKKTQNKKTKDVFVTLLLTESTSSLLKLNVPHLDHIHPDNSGICIITESDFKILREQQNTKNSGNTVKVKKTERKNDINIASDVALFSTSNCSSSSEMYDISDDDDVKSQCSSTSRAQLFNKTKIVYHPLVSVRSMAHANKLKVECNDLYVSLLDSDSLSSEFICRICHGGESIDDLLTPCRCRGTVALVHLKCLERWLKESNHSSCELCQHHYRIIRQPKYSIPWSILVFLRHPGPHLKEILLDLVAFAIYTPSAVASTYMLMLVCESLVKSKIVTTGSLSSHIIAFSAVFGMAAIDFTYSSWLILSIQKHIEAWRDWYNSNSTIKVVLPKIKMRPHKPKERK